MPPLCRGCSLPLLTATQVGRAMVRALGTGASLSSCSCSIASSQLTYTISFLCLSFLSSIPRCCLAPASAAKFQDALLRAGLVPQIPPDITALTAMETRSTPLERGQDWAQVLRGRIEAVTQQWEAQAGQSAPQGRGGSLGR